VSKEKPEEGTVQKCLALLVKCRGAGYFKDPANAKHFDADEDFNNLRDNPKFAEFASTLKQ
jgi:hypothetical protein